LPENWRDLDEPETSAAAAQWIRREQELTGSEARKAFYAKLRRKFAIETGAIEGIYHISRSATETLIEKGIDAALLLHGDTEEPAELVVSRIRDQYDALGGMYLFVSDQRQLSRSYICQLHKAVTGSQKTYIARDSLGNYVERPLIGGKLKEWPNSVEGPGGFKFDYCPPEHVDSELDRMVTMHANHVQQGVSPLVEAAWLHHRFSLIHTFPDGNGRVARLLATLVLLKNRWFPLVVVRDELDRYADGLRQADQGELRPLIQLFGLLQRRELRNAFSVAEETVVDGRQVHAIVNHVKNGLLERAQERRDRLRLLVSQLQEFARDELDRAKKEILEALKDVDSSYGAWTDAALQDPDHARSGFYKYQVGQCAKHFGYFANVPAFHAWLVLNIDTMQRHEILFSFHQVGYGASGPLVCMAMITDKVKDEDNRYVTGSIVPLCGEPFGFTEEEEDASVLRRFEGWFKDCLLAGLRIWERSTV